jgi:hypothetical protein
MRYPTPTSTLLACALTVAASTAALPRIHGYGTQLFQAVVVLAWSVVAGCAGAPFADAHHGVLWSVAVISNLVFFLVPATAVVLATRRRWPAVAVCLTLAWLAFHLAGLFWLFPATDGP